MARPLEMAPDARPGPAPMGEVAAPTQMRRRPRTSFLVRFYRSSLLGTGAAIALLVIFGIGAFASVVSPYDPLAANFAATRREPSLQYLLGTDYLGRDVLSRIFYGARISLLVAVTSVLLGDSIGFVWGVASGYIGRRFDMISQRVLDIMLSFPGLILAILLMAGLGPRLETVIIAIAISRVPLSTRVIRAVVLSVKETSYVESARCIGATSLRVMVRHVAPQCLAPFLVIFSANLGTAIFAESALAFLGIGVPEPTPTWGRMLGGVLSEAFRPPWWLIVFPGLAITITIMAANLFGDALRDMLDPRLKQRLS
ncbi:MAG: ABC transporter permease [Chloroflexi bacterium]|nr:ABC transporter permease [Chloroflexota bacterium]